jgi:hypothetical protein
MRSSRPLARRLAAPLLAAAALAAARTSVDAQSSGPACLGFAFGAWSPALDWRAAGHGAKPDSSRLQHAPAGRDWAVNGSRSESDSLMMLFPSWWPAGVIVTLPTREPAAGDTLTGRATALVANGRVAAPTARVRAWRVPCSGSR